MGSVIVSALLHYPVKGCAGVSVDRAEVRLAGLRHDRTFMLVDPDGTLLSQRTTPPMATIRPMIVDNGRRLLLAVGDEEYEHKIDLDRPRRAVSLFGDAWQGVDQGDDVAQWLSGLLDRPVRLVGYPPEQHRETAGETAGRAAFADATAALITSRTSLAELNQRIRDDGGHAVPMNRFRPNIVISGWEEAHLEDRVMRLSAGEVEFAYARRCVRCAVPTVEQSSGIKSGPEPTRTLATYRRDPAGGVSFGMQATVLCGGELAVGDTVHYTVRDELAEL